jgi:hypothetical protein
MKKDINLKSIVLFVVMFSTISCVKNDEYEVPKTIIEEPAITVNTNIEAVKNVWNQNFETTNRLIYTFDNSELYLEAYVVSSDLAGNHYKSITIQDAAKNANHGLEVLINKTSLFESFEFGRKVYIKLDGLSVSYDDGAAHDPTDANPGRYTLGFEKETVIDEIPTSIYANHILRSTEVATIVPNSISVIDFDQNNINTYVQIQDVQFDISQVGKTFAGASSDEFDGMRTLISCSDLTTAPLQTSTFSDFKSYLIPDGKGILNAILAKDFRASFFVLMVNSPTDIEFSNSERCDPKILDCSGDFEKGSVIIFNENFDDTSNSQLDSEGWINKNLSGGSEKYELKKSSGNGYMNISAYNSGERPMESWLISPAINLDTTIEEEFSFKTRAGFYQGDALKVYVSSDFTGGIKSATWILVDADLVDGPTSGYGGTFLSSGSIDLSCLSGDVFIAFAYLGADGVITTTFQIDNVRVTGNLD